MKQEPIFNLYFIIEDEIIRGRGIVQHFHGGTDEQKLKYLQNCCHTDAENCKRYPAPNNWVCVDPKGRKSAGLSWDSYQTHFAPMYGDGYAFEDIFQDFDAPQEPLMVITCIVDGEVMITGERMVEQGPF